MKRTHQRILLVDDDLGQQFLSRRALVKALGQNSTVHLVDSGNQAIAYMIGEGPFSDRKQFPFPTLVITDLNMTDGDGFDVLEFMKRNPEWAVVPRILLSSSDHDDDVRTAFFLGASAYHLKSDNMEACMRRIVEYWTTSEVPPVDLDGRLLRTVSPGGPGARYEQKPNLRDQMQRPTETDTTPTPPVEDRSAGPRSS